MIFFTKTDSTFPVRDVPPVVGMTPDLSIFQKKILRVWQPGLNWNRNRLSKRIADEFIKVMALIIFVFGKKRILTAYSGIMDALPMKRVRCSVQHILFGPRHLWMKTGGIPRLKLVRE